ncbi:MAG TPA: translation elongation factor Ts [Actinomycetota bacterium]|nr:translation elongation factor Ts [Actinomycetota bacterium]
MADEKNISAAQVKALRDATGAGMMDCKKALQETAGDMEKATEWLRQKGLASVGKRAGREANEGRVESYIHFNARVGVLVEVNSETDFVANTDEFKQLAKDVALHIASSNPRWLARDDVPTDVVDAEQRVYEGQAREQGRPENVLERIVQGKLDAFFSDNVLLDQPFVKDAKVTIAQLVDEVSAKVGEKLQVRRFARFELGKEAE